MPTEDQNIDEYLNEQAAPVEDDLAPIQGYSRPAAPVVAENSPITPDMKNALVLKAYNEAMGAGGSPELQAAEARLNVNNTDAKVPGNSPFAGFGDALGQMAQNVAKIKTDNPYISLGDKLVAARGAGLTGAIGTVLDNLANKKRADFQDQLNADTKRAQALHALHPRGQASTSLAVLNNEQRERLMAENFRKQQMKEEAAAAAADPNSDVSKQALAGAVAAGHMTAEEAAAQPWSLDNLKTWRTAKMQANRLDAQGSEADRKAHNEAIAREQARQAAEAQGIAEHQRKEQQRRTQAEIPGIVWTGGTPPSEKAQEEVRAIMPARRALVEGSQELARIQDQLQSRWGVASGLGQTLGQYIADDETKALLARAALIRENQINAARVAYGYGAPQSYELTRLEGELPRPGDIKAMLTGKARWAEAAKLHDQQLRAKLKERHAMLPDDPDVYNATPNDPDPASQVQKFDRGEYQPYQPRGARKPAQQLPEVPAVSEKLPTAPVAQISNVGKATNVPAGVYSVKMKSGWTKPRQLTAQQAASFVEQGIELKAAQ